MSPSVDARLKQLHDFIDQQGPRGKNYSCNHDVQRERGERNQLCRDLELSRTRSTDGRRPAGPRAAPPEHRGDDGDAEADRGAVTPLDVPMRVRVVDFTARQPVGNREKPKDREYDRDQERDRSISKMRFCRSAGLTPGTLAACASESGLRAASFCRDSTESVRILSYGASCGSANSPMRRNRSAA